MGRQFLMVLALTVALATQAQAGLFGKHPKPNPAERVPQLIITLKTEKDERKREAAAKELRDFDPTAHAAIVPALCDALRLDGKVSVRVEAAESLSKLRPVTAQAGQALEHAQAHDESLRVRVLARRLLWQYRLAGYRSGKADEPSLPPVPTVPAPPVPEPIQAPAKIAAAPEPAPMPPLVVKKKTPVSSPRGKPSFLPPETAPPPLLPPEPPGSAPTPVETPKQIPPPVRTTGDN